MCIRDRYSTAVIIIHRAVNQNIHEILNDECTLNSAYSNKTCTPISIHTFKIDIFNCKFVLVPLLRIKVTNFNFIYLA